MKVIHTVSEIRTALQSFRQQVIGFVPTMGYLHEGHFSLVKRAREECDKVVLSIFVNPLQFGPHEDFERYPRDFARDRCLAEQAGVDILFFPIQEEMYPETLLTKVMVTKITECLCGASRPGHFEGVATVVSKLFHIIWPHRAYFGLKDAQQVAVIQKMVTDLHFPVTIVPCPIVREADGLAMSSRNVYLSPEERKQATILSTSLQEVEEKLRQEKWMTVAEIQRFLYGQITTCSLVEVEYIHTVTFPALQPVQDLKKESDPILVAVAVRFGSTRLIDNVLVE